MDNLIPPTFKGTLSEWLHEDIPSFDYVGSIVGTKREKAVIYGKSCGVIAGLPFVVKIFELLNCS